MAEIEFISDPLVREFVDRLQRQSKSTARLYGGFLYTYYKNVLRPRSQTIAGWLAKVKEESKSEDIKVRTKWARDLESYVTNFVSEETGKPYSFKSRKVAVSAIRSFLYENVGQKTLEPYRFTLQSSEERLRTEQAKEDFVPISVDDYRKLVLGANTIRDRAILLSLPGMGVGEWLQFAHDCTTKYLDAIRNLKVPTRVSVVRPKNKQHYSVEIWDDAMEYLRLLLLEREKELGHPLGPSDQLFVSTYGDPITSHRVQHMVRFLADKLGLEKREKGKIIYKFRPHEIGRDFFRTLCDNQGVPEKIAEYSLGHKIDPNEYNKFHRTPDGQKRIVAALSKLRPYLNVVSGKGVEASNAEEVKQLENVVNARVAEIEAIKVQNAQLGKDMQTLTQALKTGQVEAIQKTIAELKEQAQKRLSASGTTRFSNHSYDYTKTDMTSPDFDAAIVDGWEIVLQSPDGKVLLRKPKAQIEIDEGTLHKVGSQ